MTDHIKYDRRKRDEVLQTKYNIIVNRIARECERGAQSPYLGTDKDNISWDEIKSKMFKETLSRHGLDGVRFSRGSSYLGDIETYIDITCPK
jgi:hypothetical protein